MALARALYGDPALIILDEPDANLDTDGEMALRNTLLALSKRGVTTLIVTHNFRLLQMVKNVLVLKEGVLLESGPREEVLKRFMRPAPADRRREESAGRDLTVLSPSRQRVALRATEYFTGCRVKPGMTNKGILHSGHPRPVIPAKAGIQ